MGRTIYPSGIMVFDQATKEVEVKTVEEQKERKKERKKEPSETG